MIEQRGSVRVDLLGGTLDLEPINIILKSVVTLNVATSLKSYVKIEKIDSENIKIISKDYDSQFNYQEDDFTRENFDKNFFGSMTFVALLLDHFKVYKKVKITLESGSPPGAGLGGSSAMGIVIYKALAEYNKICIDYNEALKIVRSIEARVLNKGPAGYQDYYPALYGGILALKASYGGVNVEQLYSNDLKVFLEENLTLVYSGKSRLSGINNWEVYKSFFDSNRNVKEGLKTIAQLAYEAYLSIKKENFIQLKNLIIQEGEIRKRLFPNILSSEIKELYNDIRETNPNVGLKVCGAGGGGCFLLIHNKDEQSKIDKKINEYKMKKLEFMIERPI